VEGYRPAFDSDTELADAEIADVTLAMTSHAGSALAGAPQRAPVQAKCFAPAQYPLPGSYSLDGITAILAEACPRSKRLR
jgi:hypothetical protein